MELLEGDTAAIAESEAAPVAEVADPVETEAEPRSAEATEPESSEPSIEELPILAVRDTVLFPYALLPLTVGRPSSVALVESLGESRHIGVVSQLDPRIESPGDRKSVV